MRLVYTFLMAILVAWVGVSGVGAQTVAITDVTVINPRAQAVLPHRTVVVDADG